MAGVCAYAFSPVPSNELFSGAQFRLVIDLLEWSGNCAGGVLKQRLNRRIVFLESPTGDFGRTIFKLVTIGVKSDQKGF
jgi:hypothetical protein